MSDYESQVLGVAPGWDNAQEFSMQMEHIEKQLHKMKKQKKGKKGKGRKKLKKRIRELEQDYQQLKQLVFFAMYQGQMQTVRPQQTWWQKAVTNTLPKVVELATVSVSKLPPKGQAPLALPEGRGRS